MIPNKTARFLSAGFWIFSLAYLFLLPFRPIPGDFLIKSVPVILLGIGVLMKLQGRERILLSLAFLFSALGDAALGLHSPEREIFFLIGLGMFFFAHLFFIFTFASDFALNKKRAPLVLLIPVYSITMAVILSAHLPTDLSIPVYAYITVLSAMGISAALHSRGGMILLAGAILFMLSDSAIAVSSFLMPKQHGMKLEFSYFIMVTYYLAQYLIARAFLREKDLERLS